MAQGVRQVTDQDLLCMKLQLEKLACQQRTGYPPFALSAAEVAEPYNIDHQSATIGRVLRNFPAMEIITVPLQLMVLIPVAVILFNRGRNK